MNQAQIHLLFNHWPIIGVMIGLILLLAGKFFPKTQSSRSGLMVLVLAALLAIPALLSGEGAEEIVEDQGVSKEVIHEHEEGAEKAFWAMEVLGVLALLALYNDHKTGKPGVLGNVTIVAAFVVTFMMVRVGHSGGLIKHPEIGEQQNSIAAPVETEEEDD